MLRFGTLYLLTFFESTKVVAGSFVRLEHEHGNRMRNLRAMVTGAGTDSKVGSMCEARIMHHLLPRGTLDGRS